MRLLTQYTVDKGLCRPLFDCTAGSDACVMCREQETERATVLLGGGGGHTKEGKLGVLGP